MKAKDLSIVSFISSYLVAHDFHWNNYNQYISCEYITLLALLMESSVPDLFIDVTEDSIKWAETVTEGCISIPEDENVFMCTAGFDYHKYADRDAVNFIKENTITNRKSIDMIYKELNLLN